MKTDTIRKEPKIPDHEVLRKIGGGAFGEIWLARGVTGAWRAVKIVWRDDYEDGREFDREFEGLLKYEPISRTSEGLVDVLHVGRVEDDSFYYYVMELADDCYDGQNFNPVEYQPRTIHSDLAEANGSPIAIDKTLEIAISLTKGLKALHDKGLAHRDIKPANVIFVNGKAKLADIGLVATRGQRTFVGTEGFVPPEGPGTAQADLYGLGKVLYEISTGKDRLQFPEAAEEIPDDKKELKATRELSKVIFDICDNNLAKRRLKTSSHLLRELEGLAKGRAATNVGFVASLKTMILASVSSTVILLGSWFLGYELNWWRFGPDQALELMMNRNSAFNYIPPPKMSKYRVQSAPSGAEVYLLSDAYGGDGETISRYLGVTPLELASVSGGVVHVRIELADYRTVEAKGVVPLSGPLVIFEELESFTPPVKDKAWQDSRGRKYVPEGNAHISINHVNSHDWNLFQQWTNIKYEYPTEAVGISENGVTQDVVFATPNGMASYCEWLTNESRDGGRLSDKQTIESAVNKTIAPATVVVGEHSVELRPFRCRVYTVKPAQVTIESDPPGARVTLSGNILEGQTPMTIKDVDPKSYQVLVTKEGYRPSYAFHRFGNGQTYQLKMNLEKAGEVEFGQPWENSLGMKFLPVGDSLLVSKWETRLGDYQVAVNEGGTPRIRPAMFKQTAKHPITGVSREDAESFCEWLTLEERNLEKINDAQEYRLPTDAEWSLFVGLNEPNREHPVQLERFINRGFPWGEKWPPVNEAKPWSNLADASAVRALTTDAGKAIEGYDDSYPNTSPVGEFPANELGLYDLGGNVREWVSSPYDSLGKFGVLRGGAWNSFKEESSRANFRYTAPPSVRDSAYGFRVVLAPSRTSQQRRGSIDEEEYSE